MSIAEYLEWFIFYIPYNVYGWWLIAFLVVLALMIVWKGVGRGIRYAVAFLLAEYTALILYFTVFLHRSEGGRQMMLTPFWSYRAIHQGTKILIQEHAMNIAVYTHWHDVRNYHAGSGMVEGHTCRYGYLGEHRTVTTDSDERVL